MHYHVVFINNSSHIKNFSIPITHEEFEKITKKKYPNIPKYCRRNYHPTRSINYPIKKCSMKQTPSRIVVVTNFFTNKTKINDVWRYNLVFDKNQNYYPRLLPFYASIQNPKINFIDQHPKLTTLPTIVIIIESPHKAEYDNSGTLPLPLAPANGKTGKGIDNCLSIILNDLRCRNKISLPPYNYSIIICNPVQYQTSLYHLTDDPSAKDLKNKIWTELFIHQSLNTDFIARLKSYNPSLIINACTGGMNNGQPRGLKKLVDSAIRNEPSFQNKLNNNPNFIIYTTHPSYWDNFGLI